MIQIEHFIFNCFQTRCSVVWDESGSCAFVDPGCADSEELSRLTSFVASRGLTPVAIMLTHAHFDHIYGMSALAREYGVPVYAHEHEMFTLESTNPYVCEAYGLPSPETFPMIRTADEESLPSRFEAVAEGDVIRVGALRFEVIETPGHTPGGLCFYERACGVLFAGDTLFAGAIGRTDHPGGDYDQLMSSILRKLLPLDSAAAAAYASAPSSGRPSGSASGCPSAPDCPSATGHEASASCQPSAPGPGRPSDSPVPSAPLAISVVPGHGPCTDLATEGMTNPFLQPFNEPFEG